MIGLPPYHKGQSNTLWEVIKGNIRNETIKFSTNKKPNELLTEKKINKEIEDLETQIQQSLDLATAENLHTELKSKQNALTEIIDNRVNGSIIRAKAQYIENNENNSKYFSSLEKKRSESKIIKQLNIKGNIEYNQKTILSDQKSFYEKLY